MVRHLVKKIVVLVAVFSAILILLPNCSAFFTTNTKFSRIPTNQNPSTTESENIRWIDGKNNYDVEANGYFFASYANDDEEMDKKTFDSLRSFFKGCKDSKDFYDRMQLKVKDAGRNQSLPALSMNKIRLSEIVNVVLSGSHSLWCHQQAILLAGGIKAIFSYYNESKGKCFLDDAFSAFDLCFYRSYDTTFTQPWFPWRSHIQIVVWEWNGDASRYIEIDTWEDEYEKYDTIPTSYKYNSKIKTETFATDNDFNEYDLKGTTNVGTMSITPYIEPASTPVSLTTDTSTVLLNH